MTPPTTPRRHRFIRPLPADRRVRRLLQLTVGLALFGISVAMIVRAGLGAGPWDIFHQGVGRRTPLTFGTVVILTSIVVLLLWVPLRERPGLGTLANAVAVGVGADLTLLLLPDEPSLVVAWALLLGGILINGIATGMYIGAGLGPGPRDGLMTGIAARGFPVGVVRTSIELTVLFLGFLLGGVVGIGTVLYAVGIGPLAHVFLPLFDLDGRRAATVSDPGRTVGA